MVHRLGRVCGSDLVEQHLLDLFRRLARQHALQPCSELCMRDVVVGRFAWLWLGGFSLLCHPHRLRQESRLRRCDDLCQDVPPGLIQPGRALLCSICLRQGRDPFRQIHLEKLIQFHAHVWRQPLLKERPVHEEFVQLRHFVDVQAWWLLAFAVIVKVLPDHLH